MKTRIIGTSIFEEKLSNESNKSMIHYIVDFVDRRDLPLNINLANYHIETVFKSPEVNPSDYIQKVLEIILSWLNDWHKLVNFENKQEYERELIDYLARMTSIAPHDETPKLAYKRIELPWK